MRYLIVDACLSGTGVRDKYESGYLNPQDLNISTKIIDDLKKWLKDYKKEHYNDFQNTNLILELDEKGKKIALSIKRELKEVKVEYFSDARMTRVII